MLPESCCKCCDILACNTHGVELKLVLHLELAPGSFTIAAICSVLITCMHNTYVPTCKLSNMCTTFMCL